ncbi:SurA N-terminal domain-containing protein [Alkalihalobacillus oceani]|uniref:SurA N-terminal domain-containing protein n=1 Tax=Halalkalibacter oceani TaxID=1653776 RepID=UPI0020425417|nr:SurA N-terminal domain-containing protein [Halalkalibacter oceani]MCM3760719.1 SurA N-terminal domain-containing protein [Halalkalibacter oceani]
MKKMFMIFGTGLLALSLAACGGDSEQQADTPEEDVAETDQQAPENEEAAQDPQSVLDTENIPDVIATVNGEDINKDIYVASLEQQANLLLAQGIELESEEAAGYLEMLEEQLLQQIINERMIIQAADNEGIEATDEEIDAELELITSQFESEEQLQEVLDEQGVTMEELRSDISDFVKRDKYVEAHTTTEEVSEEELQAAYDELAEMAGEDGGLPTFEEYREELQAQLQSEKQQEQLSQIIEDLRAESDITIHI